MLRGSSQLVSDDEVLWNLQTISSTALSRQTLYLFEKGRFPDLRQLRLQIPSDLKDNKLQKLLPSLQQLSRLNKLQLSFHKLKNFMLERQCSCKPKELLQCLQQLTLLSTLKINYAYDLPTCGVAFPQNLTKLVLEGISCTNDDRMNALGSLTQLRILKLTGSFPYTSFELNCSAGGFPQLQKFVMRLLKVHCWRLASATMPCLQSLVIESCPALDSLPNELWSLTALRKVWVRSPNDVLSLALRNLERKDVCELTINDEIV